MCLLLSSSASTATVASDTPPAKKVTMRNCSEPASTNRLHAPDHRKPYPACCMSSP